MGSSMRVVVLLALGFVAASEGATLSVRSDREEGWSRGPHRSRTVGSDLQEAIEAAADGDTIRIGPGLFGAHPHPFLDPLCGNCLEHRTEVQASTGFRIVGKRLALIGAGPAETVLMTEAGYGIYLENADGSSIRDLSVTGGHRDPDGNATDAAIVVRGGRVLLENLHLRDNTARAEGVVVGIGGVMGREGAEVEVRDCRIVNNGWDGVALYRGAMARISDNVIEEGRGAGIGITWDAVAIVQRNRVSRYWKGIGTFGTSRAVVRNNAVFDNLGWGIIATGESFLEATHNVVFRNGNCGFAVWSEEATGFAANNIVAENGWRKEWVCPRVGIWHRGKQGRFPVRFNGFFRNGAGDWLSEAGEGPAAIAFETDPCLRGSDDFRLHDRSPAIDAGDPGLTDANGTRPDIGLTGGPAARSRTGAPPARLPAERHRIGSPVWLEGRP